MSTELQIGGTFHQLHPGACPACQFELLHADVEDKTFTCVWCGLELDAITQI